VVTTVAVYSPLFYYCFAAPAFIKALADGEFLILPAIGPLAIIEAFLFRIPKTHVAGVLLLLYTIGFGIGSWSVTFPAYRRSPWWTVSVTALLFGLSFYGCFAMYGLWAM